MSVFASNIVNAVNRLQNYQAYGRVTAIVGLLVEVGGLQGSLSIGDHCRLRGRGERQVLCEVVGFRDDRALLLPFDALGGIGLGCSAEIASTDPSIYPHTSWLGRVVNAFGEPVDGKGPLDSGETAYPIHRQPPHAHTRKRVAGKIDLGIRSINAFLTCCRGQRMGIFAGSGIGKSTILSMMARHTDAEVSVIGLVGERGREAREFIEDDLGEEGLARSVVVLASSDEPPLVRRQAAYVTMAVAEYFRDQRNDVLCLMDSVTRFAMAQREISLSAGEPPASKGYTPSVFAELPKLLERAGQGNEEQGSITGLFTVLVEGDDHNEPVSDAVRGILDGHIVLDRAIAERGRYPAVNILRSISRVMPACNTPEENAVVARARKLIATYEDMAELIRLGAYRRGSDPEVDEAIHYYPMLETFLTQLKSESTGLAAGYDQLAGILDMKAVLHPESAEQAPAAAPGQTQPQTQAPSRAHPQPSQPARPPLAQSLATGGSGVPPRPEGTVS
ncbi:MAG: flagellar protein export ATPase FliI [Rhodospirillales bacterium]